jgi:bacillithiol biosynthesis deacetylase BshB1
MKLDILAIGAHPDDVELSCSGTLISHANKGYKTGVLDLTKGEMSTRGTTELRLKEAKRAGEIMGLSVRENLGLPDTNFVNDLPSQLRVIEMLRKYRPEIVLANAAYDRHPDHGRAASLIEDAIFKSGLKKIATSNENVDQEAWRPKKLYHYIQSVSVEPDFFVDVSDAMKEKMEAILSYQSQFFDPNIDEPDTYISSPAFLKMIEARSLEYGHRIGVEHAEGFTQKQFLGLKNLFDLT